MDLRLAFYASWALEVLAFSLLTVWGTLKDINDQFLGPFWWVPILLVEASLSIYLSVKIRTAIHRRRPHLFDSAAATDLFLTSTRDGAAYMALATTIWLIILAFGSVGLFMASFMGLYDAGDPPRWAEALVLLFWIGYLSFFAHLLYVWVVSIRVAVFGPRRTLELD
ncbi:hypothetical protein B0T10DRAFT_466831 [Thelonectria olida]|uniref:Uncharacterized protein n=1 Tax=Thelonectria olida TaxID=1576542 RepID=A0A9P8VS79_9HYPO|nr:hypothetical protein B0T10DRAFT_466831 [Thelonectria olida]